MHIAQPTGSADRLGRLLRLGQRGASFFADRVGSFAREKPAVFALTSAGLGLGLWAGAKARRDGLVFSQNPHESLFPPPELYVRTRFLSQAARIPRREAFLFPETPPAPPGGPADESGNLREREAGAGEGDADQTACAVEGRPASISALLTELLPPEVFAPQPSARRSSLRALRSPLIHVGRGTAAFRHASRLLLGFDPRVFSADRRGEAPRGEISAVHVVTAKDFTSDTSDRSGGRGASCLSQGDREEELRVGDAAALLLRRGSLRWRLVPLTVASRERNCALVLGGPAEEAAGTAEAAVCMQPKETEFTSQGRSEKAIRPHVQGDSERSEGGAKEKDICEENTKLAPSTVALCSSLWFATAPSAVSSAYSGFVVFRVFLLPSSRSLRRPATLPRPTRATGDVFVEVLAANEQSEESPLSEELLRLLAERLAREIRRQLAARTQRLRALGDERRDTQPRRVSKDKEDKDREGEDREGEDREDEKKDGNEDDPECGREEESEDDLWHDASYETWQRATPRVRAGASFLSAEDGGREREESESIVSPGKGSGPGSWRAESTRQRGEASFFRAFRGRRSSRWTQSAAKQKFLQTPRSGAHWRPKPPAPGG